MVVAAYDFAGRESLEKRPGTFSSMHGYCSCPVLFEDMVIVNGDHDGDAYLVALDRKTRATRSGRSTARTRRAATRRRIIREIDGRTQMILSGSKCVASYDPRDGSRHWIIDGPTEQFVASMVYNGKLLFLTAGYPEQHMLAMRPDGQRQRDRHAHRLADDARGRLRPLADRGGRVLSGRLRRRHRELLRSATGKRLWKQRLGTHYSASPVAADGLVYFLADDGVTTVVQPGPKFDVGRRRTSSARTATLRRPSAEGQDFPARREAPVRDRHGADAKVRVASTRKCHSNRHAHLARLADHAGRGDDRAGRRADRRLDRVTVGQARASRRIYWAMLAVGTMFLVLVLVGVVLYLLISIKEIRLNQRQSNFIDSVTHELKIADRLAQALSANARPAQVTERAAGRLSPLHAGGRGAARQLINHLLDAARLDREPVDAPLADVDLPADAAQLRANTCLRYHLPDEQRFDCELEPAVVQARPIDLEMVFRNLIDNAIKYGGTQPKVEVGSLAAEDGRVTADHRQRAGHSRQAAAQDLRPLRAAGQRAGAHASGHRLGLFIVRQLVRRMRGKINVRRPRRRAGHDLRGSTAEDELRQTERRCKHILVVEDEPHIANGIKYNLEAEGYFVTTVGRGAARACALCRSTPARSTWSILDLMLPGMSGYAVCEEVRRHEVDIPILMLSARTLTEDRIRGFDVGADQYLQKPFDLEELLSIVATCFRDETQERRGGAEERECL